MRGYVSLPLAPGHPFRTSFACGSLVQQASLPLTTGATATATPNLLWPPLDLAAA